MKIYRKILELRPAWTEKVGVIMTDSNKDPEEWKEIIGNKRYKEEMAKKFKDNNDPFKIAIVVDYVDIASALKEAMNDYTSRDKKNYGDTDVAKVAYPKILEKLSECL